MVRAWVGDAHARLAVTRVADTIVCISAALSELALDTGTAAVHIGLVTVAPVVGAPIRDARERQGIARAGHAVEVAEALFPECAGQWANAATVQVAARQSDTRMALVARLSVGTVEAPQAADASARTVANHWLRVGRARRARRNRLGPRRSRDVARAREARIRRRGRVALINHRDCVT
jgi:hypothetical protein